jgi:tetratricopeptide (TPR) repeat protein
MLGVGVLMTATCRRGRLQTEVVEAGIPAPLNVEWAGCAGVRKGPVCELGGQRVLVLWVGGPAEASLSVVTDRGSAAGKTELDVGGGTRLTVDVPVGAHKIEIRDAVGRSRWSLPVADARLHQEIDRLVALGRTGRYADALAGLEALRARASSDERGQADAAIARMAIALGQVDRAEPAFRSSIAAAKAEGRIADVAKDSAGLLWALAHVRQRYADARTLLEEMTPFGEQYPEGRVWLDYHAGLLASDTTDVRTALEKYRAAERGAHRLGQSSLEESSADEVARVLTRIGSAEEAVEIARKLPLPKDACARATRALNLAESFMERAAHRQGRERDPEVATALGTARQAAEACPDPNPQLLAVVYSAEYAMAIDDDIEAERFVGMLQALPVDRDVLRASRRGDVLGRWLLRRGKALAALATFENQIPAARAVGLLEETFRGEVGAGRSLLALGRRGVAVARLKRAQELLEQMLRGIPIEEGRGSFLGGHDDGVRYLVTALIEGGAIREAMRAARWIRSIELAHAARLDRLARLPREARHRWDEALSRYREIRAEIEHQAEGDWSVAHASLAKVRAERQIRAEQARVALDDAYRLLADDRGASGFELSEPSPGDVYLVFFPGSAGWFAFAATTRGVVARRIEDRAFSSPREAEAVLALLAPQLGAARRVRLFPYGAANQTDWQAVNWNGRPLISWMQVEYGLDVGTKVSQAPAIEPTPTALVVSNPTGDLPATIPEGDGVVRALAGWRVTRLDGPTATRAATLEDLPTARLFHYAGHAQASGLAGSSSALLLKDDARVELGDLLAAPSVPDLVFLSACEAAGTNERHTSLMGLAQVFIAAGGHAVVAPARSIRDEEARAFVAAFYSAFVPSSAGKVGPAPTIDRAASLALFRAAFRSAALEVLARRDPKADAPGVDGAEPKFGGWESLRLLVP